MNAGRPAPVRVARQGRLVRLRKLLHASYFRGAGMHFFLARRLRPTGIALIIVLVLGSVLGVGHSRDSVYQIFSLAFGMGGIGVVWAFFRKAEVELRREPPAHATAGETVRFSIRVRNVGRRRLRRAWLAETPPDARPPLAEFLDRREPGEENRNGFDRVLAYYRWQWLMNRRRLFDGGASLDEIDLKPGESTRITMEITPLRRGVIRLHDARILLPDPFGLVQRCRRAGGPAATLTVLPKRYLLPPVGLPGSSRFQLGGDAANNATGNSGEFVGLRDYRPGDPLRQIHWKSWARTGRPIVKELEDNFFPRYGLVLDTFPAAGDDTLFEDGVSVAASFAVGIDTRESLLDLMFIRDEAHLVTVGRGFARAEKLLEVLAAVEADGTADFDTLARLVLRHRDELTSCVVIFCGWCEVRSSFLRTLQRGGIICAPIIIGHGPRPDGLPGHWVETGHLARDLRRFGI